MSIVLTDDCRKQAAARSVPGSRWDKITRAYVMDTITPRGAAVALRLFPELADAEPGLVKARDSLVQDLRPIDNATPYDTPVAAKRLRNVLFGRRMKFYRYQELDLGYIAAVLEAHGGAYLGWERGLGKTLGACALVDELDCKAVLVVCPNTAKRSVWEPELRRFLPWMDVVVLRNNREQRERDLGHVKQLRAAGIPVVLVAHYEALTIVGGARGTGWATATGGKFDMVIADEAHRIANPTTKMAKALKKIATTYKLALSGSIIQNHADELFSPLQWLFPDRYRSKWRDWNDRYLDYVDSGFGRVCVGVRIETLPELRDELGRFMCYRRKQDELDLPPRTDQTLLVDLSSAQRRAYNDVRDQFLTELDDGTVVTATDVLAQLTRLRQLATGLDLVSGELTDSSKQEVAVEMIQDNPDEAFVVFSWYKAAARSLAKRLDGLGIGNFVVDGDVAHGDRAAAIERFQAGAGRVFIGTIKTLGESVTLTRASNVVFLDRSFNPGDNAQAEDRAYRIGQERPVTVTHLVAKDTVDEQRVLPILKDKQQIRKMILGAGA